MPSRIAPRGRRLEFHSPQRKELGRREIACAMFVVNRQRLDRFP